MILVLLVVIFGMNSCYTARDYSKETPFVEIIEIQNTSKTVLFNDCESWFYDEFKDDESKIVKSDSVTGKIICFFQTSYFENQVIVAGTKKFRTTMSIEIKNNKLRVEIKDPHFYNTLEKIYKPIWAQKYYDRERDNWPKIVKSLKEYLLKKSNNDNDW